MSRVTTLLSELRRRRVYRVAVVYAAGAFVVAQVAELFLPRLAMPDWTVTLVVVLAVAGFPVALILGWAFDITPAGVRRTEAAAAVSTDEPERAPARRPGLRRVAGGIAASGVVLAAGSWLLGSLAFGPPSRVHRLAVLPLANLMDDDGQDYFVDGMHDALIAELAQAGIGVIARTSALPYRHGDKRVREIARELNVGAVIAGSVLRAGDSVRIRVQLIDGDSEEHIWARTYDAELRDVLALHRRVTRDVAREIRSTLTPRARARLAAHAPAVNPDAYEAYLKGRLHWLRLDRAGLDAALGYFELALEHDPHYALAHTGIAIVWGLRAHLGIVRPVEAIPKSAAAIRRALELDPDLPEAHAQLAGARFYHDWDWPAAEAAMRHALELNSGHPELRVWYAELLAVTGRPDDAVAEVRRALELDPHNSTFHAWLGQLLLLTGRDEESIAQLQDLLRRDPAAPLARGLLMGAFERKGRYEDAFAEARRIASGGGNTDLVTALDRAYAEGGYRHAMLAWAEFAAGRAAQGYRSPVRIARFYAWAQDHERTLEWLERGYDERDSQMLYLPVAPAFDFLRGDRRFRELLLRMKLLQ